MPEQKRTLFIIFNLNSSGGTQRMMLNYLNLLGEKGHKPVLYLYASGAGTGSQDQLNKNINCYQCSAKGKLKHWKRIKKLRQIIKVENINNIISFATNGAYMALITQMFRPGKKIPVIYRMVSVDSAINDQGNKYLSKIMAILYIKVLIPNVEKVISQTSQMGELLKQKNPKKFDGKIIANRNFLNPEVIIEKSKDAFSSEKPYILFVGRLSEEKYIDKIISSYYSICNKHPHQLIIVGDGDMRQQLENQVLGLGITNRVLFVGRQDNPYKYMKQAELLVLFSRYEGFPNVILEGMLCETAVISSRFAGVDEIIADGVNGWIVENGNIEKLAQSIDKLLNNPSIAAHCSNTAFEMVQNENAKAAEQYIDLAI
jgi:glycosyltransferase involved in cell wall biosynthesis